MPQQFVAYYRVSTGRQGRSGLGLEAQQAAIRGYLGTTAPIAEFTEVETGKRNDRPALKQALALCRKRKARLVIAKLDRLSRNLAFIATMMDSGVEFVAVDNPHATRLTLHILAAVAEHERELIADRTKAALQAAKARGIRLGRNGADRLAPAYRAEAIERARQLAPLLAELKSSGMSAVLRAVSIPRIGGIALRLWRTPIGEFCGNLRVSTVSRARAIGLTSRIIFWKVDFLIRRATSRGSLEDRLFSSFSEPFLGRRVPSAIGKSKMHLPLTHGQAPSSVHAHPEPVSRQPRIARRTVGLLSPYSCLHRAALAAIGLVPRPA